MTVECSDYIGCCGLQELSGIQESKTETALLCAHWNGGTYLVFSCVDRGHASGEALVKMIAELGFGEVTTMEPRKNTNSGNQLKVWLWAPDHEALEAWQQKNYPGQTRQDFYKLAAQEEDVVDEWRHKKDDYSDKRWHFKPTRNAAKT